MVDDGSHLPEHQLLTFRRLFPSITPGGLYIIEGTETSYWKEGAKLEGAVGHPHYNISGEVDIVNTFQRATNLIINREFRCDNLAKLEPIFSDDIDATITSVTFIRNAIIVRKVTPALPHNPNSTPNPCPNPNLCPKRRPHPHPHPHPKQLPEDFIVHTSYRNHNMACDPEGEAEREAVEAADAEAQLVAEAQAADEDEAAAAEKAEAEAEADNAETQR